MFSRSQALVALAVVVLARPGRAQEYTFTAAEGIVIVLGDGRLAVLKSERGSVVVSGLVPGEKPTGPVADVQMGDQVVSMQGEVNPSLERVRATYEGLPVGTDIVLGLKRGSAAPHLVRFARPATVPAGARRAVMTGDKPGGAGAWVGAGPPSNVAEVVIAGAHIRNNDQGLPQVTHRSAHPAAATVTLRAGDVITAINGKSIAALAGLELFYQPIEAGGEVVLTVTREGREVRITFRKPSDP